jgi:hypothetical protein
MQKCFVKKDLVLQLESDEGRELGFGNLVFAKIKFRSVKG